MITFAELINKESTPVWLRLKNKLDKGIKDSTRLLLTKFAIPNSNPFGSILILWNFKYLKFPIIKKLITEIRNIIIDKVIERLWK